MNTGISGKVQASTMALIQSRAATTTQRINGTIAVDTNAVRVFV